jgi:hypothetical protein
MVVFGVLFEVRCEFVDTSGQQSHLDFGTACIACGACVVFDDFSNGCCQHGFFLKYLTCVAPWKLVQRAVASPESKAR